MFLLKPKFANWDSGAWPTRRLNDGSLRYLVHPQTLFGKASDAPVPLCRLIFLGERVGSPVLQRRAVSHDDLIRMTPFEGSFAAGPKGNVALRIIRLLNEVKVYLLKPGTISETVNALETLGDCE